MLFRNSDALEPDDIDGYARELGLDMDRFEDDIRTGDYVVCVEDDELDATSSDVGGTPTFYLGVTGQAPRRLEGPHDAATLIAELERLRAQEPVQG